MLQVQITSHDGAARSVFAGRCSISGCPENCKHDALRVDIIGCLLCRHDFVVVETIDFYADEDAELPPPMTQRDVIILNKAGLEEEEAPEEEDAGAARDGKV